MKKVISKIFLIFSITVFFTSCDSYLDPGYDEYLDKDEVFTSYTYSLNYIRTMYSYLPNDAYYETCMTDEAKNCFDGSAYQMMNDGSWDSRTYIESWKWSTNYAGIRRVHVFLENVDKAIFLDPNTYKLTPYVNDEMRIQLRAEARFLRAFYYFELLKRFGSPAEGRGVPIVPERSLSIADTLDFAQNSYDECVKYIVNDCDSAAKILPIRQSVSDYGKASKSAALALKSRVLLYAASPLANPTDDPAKWKLALDAAKAVIDLGVYKLLDYKEVGKTNDNLLKIFVKPNNDEVIYSSPVIQSNSFESANFPPSFAGGGQINPTQDLVDAFETNQGYPILHGSSLYNPALPYSRRDKRLEYFIARNAATIGTVTVDTYVGGKDGLNKGIGATKTGYYIRKFADPTANIVTNLTLATHFWVHFRYAEILLNYAEAMAHVNGPVTAPAGYTKTALAALMEVRDRQSADLTASRTPAYIKTLTTAQFLEFVKNERRVELCFEGHRFWDVRRWKEGEKYFNAPIHGMKITKTGSSTFTYEIFEVEQRVFDAKMYTMPVPYAEIQKSKMLLQNTGW